MLWATPDGAPGHFSGGKAFFGRMREMHNFQCTDVTDEPAVRAAMKAAKKGRPESVPNRYTDAYDRGAVRVTRMVAQAPPTARL